MDAMDAVESFRIAVTSFLQNEDNIANNEQFDDQGDPTIKQKVADVQSNNLWQRTAWRQKVIERGERLVKILNAAGADAKGVSLIVHQLGNCYSVHAARIVRERWPDILESLCAMASPDKAATSVPTAKESRRKALPNALAELLVSGMSKTAAVKALAAQWGCSQRTLWEDLQHIKRNPSPKPKI